MTEKKKIIEKTKEIKQNRGYTWVEQTSSRTKQNQVAMPQGSKHYQPVPSKYKGGGPMVKGFRGCGLVVGGEGVYIWFLAMAAFRNITCWDDILPKRGSRWLGPSDACHRGR